jgi:hypothetical protein
MGDNDECPIAEYPRISPSSDRRGTPGRTHCYFQFRSVVRLSVRKGVWVHSVPVGWDVCLHHLLLAPQHGRDYDDLLHLHIDCLKHSQRAPPQLTPPEHDTAEWRCRTPASFSVRERRPGPPRRTAPRPRAARRRCARKPHRWNLLPRPCDSPGSAPAPSG